MSVFMWVTVNSFTHPDPAKPFGWTTCARPIGKKDSMVPEEFKSTNYKMNPSKIKTSSPMKKPPEGGFLFCT